MGIEKSITNVTKMEKLTDEQMDQIGNLIDLVIDKDASMFITHPKDRRKFAVMVPPQVYATFSEANKRAVMEFLSTNLEDVITKSQNKIKYQEYFKKK